MMARSTASRVAEADPRLEDGDRALFPEFEGTPDTLQRQIHALKMETGRMKASQALARLAEADPRLERWRLRAGPTSSLQR
jgi:hypothetical protein